MSDDWICVIPTEPNFVPTESAAVLGQQLLARFAPVGAAGEPAQVIDEGRVVFVDAGSNFTS